MRAQGRESQNVILLRDIKDRQDVQEIKPSIFGNEEPATEIEAAEAILPLTYCFPQMPSPFWGFVTKEAMVRGVSKKRLKYIVDTIISNHHYATLTIADIFDIDKYIHELTPAEFYSIDNTKPIAQIFFAGRYRIVYREDAERYGYMHKPFYTNAERAEMERNADDARHRIEMQEWMKEHPDEMPSEETPDLFNIIEGLSNEYAVKKKQ